MSIQDTGSTGKAGVKTLAIRLEPETHAQLSLVAQLRGNTITDEIKAALDAHIAAVKTTPDLAARAGSVLASSTQHGVAVAKPLIRICRSIGGRRWRTPYDSRYAPPP